MTLQTLDWEPTLQFQIGPQIEGYLEGKISTYFGVFYVSPSQNTKVTIAEYSSDQGNSWHALPNATWVMVPPSIPPGIPLQYRLNVPHGMQVTFIVGL
jgi:hypothetical protein